MAAPLNPLRAPGTVLPPQLLLMAKLAVLVMPGPPFSPVAMVLFPLGAATLFLTRFVRSACLLLSAVELREVLISPRALEIHLYPIVLLLVAGLYQPSMGRSLLRWPALRRVYPWAAWSAVLLQTVLLWREHHPFGTFDCTILASYLLFAEWPEGKLRVIYDDQSPFCAWIKNRLERLDWAEAFEWEPQQEQGAALRVVGDGKVWSGFAAMKAMVLYNPVPYFAVFLTLPVAGLAGSGLGNWLMAVLLVLFSPFFGPIGEAGYRWVARLRYRLPR